MKEHRENMKDLLDEFHYHEMCDRLYIIIDTVDNHLIQHPVCKLNKDISKRVDAAQALLFEAYQLAGTYEIGK